MEGYGTGSEGDLIVKKDETKRITSDICHNYKNIIIHENGILTVEQVWDYYSKKGGKLIINVTNDVIMHPNARIHCNEAGYWGARSSGFAYF